MSLKFGTDGVRGVANTELTPELALAFGRAAARVLGTGTAFAVGRDTRRSGPLLEAAFVAGLARPRASTPSCSASYRRPPSPGPAPRPASPAP